MIPTPKKSKSNEENESKTLRIVKDQPIMTNEERLTYFWVYVYKVNIRIKKEEETFVPSSFRLV